MCRSCSPLGHLVLRIFSSFSAFSFSQWIKWLFEIALTLEPSLTTYFTIVNVCLTNDVFADDEEGEEDEGEGEEDEGE